VSPLKTLVLGAGGQLGRALRSSFGDADAVEFAGREELDLVAADLARVRDWRRYDTVINAAAFTAVDDAETAAGRRAAWATNATAVAALARVAAEHRLTVVHVSSDYVFDGEMDRPYREDDAVCPLGVYGQSKAAGDAIVATVPRHFVVRTSWVIGEGANFVSTMARLARAGASPAVVDDQVGRPTFAADLAGAIRHLLGDSGLLVPARRTACTTSPMTGRQCRGSIWRGRCSGWLAPIRARCGR
jgi:dTDP-4-dehydrorhamnose 3,5-epimerase